MKIDSELIRRHENAATVRDIAELLISGAVTGHSAGEDYVGYSLSDVEQKVSSAIYTDRISPAPLQGVNKYEIQPVLDALSQLPGRKYGRRKIRWSH